MTRRIQRQRETFAYRVASDVPGYPREYGKTEWTPEKEALATELGERLKLKGISGLTAENMTAALQELILMERERNETPWSEDYDKAYNDWEAGADDKTARRIAARALMAVLPMNAPNGYNPADYDPHDPNAGNPPHEALLSRLEKKFMAWYREHGQEHLNYAGRGPLGNWHQIEQFLKMHYPEAHRGLNTGLEGAMPLIDYGDQPDRDRRKVFTEEKLNNLPGYATGPEAVAQRGYDPKEIAAGMLLLHNRTHDHRGGDIEQAGVDRLYDIAKKRSEMQRAYEQRTAKHQQGETVPNIFNEKVAAALDEPSLDSLQQSFRDFIIKRKPINPHTGQPHTPETAITDWLSGVVPFIQAVHPNLPYERYRYEPHTRGVDDLHDIPATIEKLIALHTREKYGNEMLLRRIQSDEIRQQSQTVTRDLENQFSKGYGVDNGKLVPMPPREYPRGADLERRLFQTQQPRQPFDTTPKPTPMPGGQPMPIRNPLPQPMSESDAMRLEIQKARAASLTIIAALACMAE